MPATLFVFAVLVLLPRPTPAADQPAADAASWSMAHARAVAFADCAASARRLLEGWIDVKRDPQTQLFSRGGVWDYHDEAADHYSSLVLIAFYLKPELIQRGGWLHQTLTNSQRLCATPAGLPTLYNLNSWSPGRPARPGELAEWLRDGLIRIVEVLGTDNDWYQELERLTDALLRAADQRGGMVSTFSGSEPAGSMLQVLARLHVLSGKEPYLVAAEALADFYLLGAGRLSENYRYEDHGCELVPGLGELFVVECQLQRPKATAYKEPFRKLLDAMLAADAHPETGLLCGSTAGSDGRRQWKQPPDTWGYVLFAYQNYDQATGENRYAPAVAKALRWLTSNRDRYEALQGCLWPRSLSSDDWSDSYESMIVLWNHTPDVPGVFPWLEWATHQHCHRRHRTDRYGPYTGGHFDGSTGRTLCLHMLLNSQGAWPVPFVEGLRVGGVRRDGALYLSLESEQDWAGKICLGCPGEAKAGQLNWARINEMPAWYVVRPQQRYALVVDAGDRIILEGRKLAEGFDLAIKAHGRRQVCIRPADEK